MSDEVIIVVPEKEVFSDEQQTGRRSGMHPGVINGRRIYPLENTSKPYKSGKGKLGAHQKRLSDRRNAHSMTLKQLTGKTPPGAYKTPGSMKQANG